MVVKTNKDHPSAAATPADQVPSITAAASQPAMQTPSLPLTAPPAAVFSGALIGGVILGYAVGPLWTIVGTVAGIAVGEFFAYRGSCKERTFSNSLGSAEPVCRFL